MTHAPRSMPRRRLYALSGLKVLAVLAVFCWHALPKNNLIDLGARACELLFAVSGFLVAYNHHDRFTGTFDEAARYVWRKVRRFYPLYLVSLALSIVALCFSRGAGWITPRALLALPLHLLLLQAWFPRIAMDYNRAAWFLSTILVCYAAAPFIAAAVRRAQQRLGRRRGLAAVFWSAFALRAFLEICYAYNADLFPFSIHTNPFIRLLEFAMAYACGVAFSQKVLGPWIERHRACARALEHASVTEGLALAVAALSIVFDNMLPRFALVLVMCLITIVFAYERGAISRLLARRPFQRAARLEMPFYLLHWDIIQIVLSIVRSPLGVAVSFFASVAAAWAASRARGHVSPGRGDMRRRAVEAQLSR